MTLAPEKMPLTAMISQSAMMTLSAMMMSLPATMTLSWMKMTLSAKRTSEAQQPFQYYRIPSDSKGSVIIKQHPILFFSIVLTPTFLIDLSGAIL